MLSRDDLAAAARMNDEAVDRGLPVPALMMNLGIDPRGAVYVAEQRALRYALLQSGWTLADLQALAAGSEPRPVKLPREQLDMIPVYAGIFLDGLTAGVRASDEAHKP